MNESLQTAYTGYAGTGTSVETRWAQQQVSGNPAAWRSAL